MVEEQEITLAEQLEFLDGEIELREEIGKHYRGESDAVWQRGIETLKAIRESVMFDLLMHQAVNAENAPWLEETTVCS